MQLFDTHCHIDLEEFDQDRDQVLVSAREQGVSDIVVPGISQNRWSCLLEVCASNNGLHAAIGLHPMYLSEHDKTHLELLESALAENVVVAVGEVGLDFYISDVDKHEQIELLDAQLAIAKSADLPIILHCRKAYDDLIKLLTQHQLKGGIAHAFNGSLQQAGKLINLGFKLGFGGMLTYERSTKLKGLAWQLPIESLVLETDSPFMTVSQYQGKRNSPAYLPYVLQALSDIRPETVEDIAYQTYQNSLEVFSI